VTGIETTLHALAALTWDRRLDPRIHLWARQLTGPHASQHAKMRAIVCEVQKHLRPADPAISEAIGHVFIDFENISVHDADDVCLLLAAAAMSVGIPCQFVAARFGDSWTCWLTYLTGDRWNLLDPAQPWPQPQEWELPTPPPPARDPDEKVFGPVPDTASWPDVATATRKEP
jgi:hypothetical protein